ncbi:MAG: SDR family NAD(P)-dependent oxidoreductase [Candidatus Scalindua sp.]|nr:SDR family NAD(P)-dependent oxidoreductase [Candidatus Scalindua sp.]
MNQETHDSLEPIAIIGMSCRFPGAGSVHTFWENMKNGVESVSFFTDEELQMSGIGTELLNNPDYVKAKAVLEDMEMFDASFFGFTPREAEMMDPQHRLFLECAWEAMENAGYDSGRYGGRVGVYAGVGLNTYLLRNLLSNPDLVKYENEYQILIGNDKDFVPTRVSYKLNLKGPSVSVNTACSTSLVAIHFACQSLLNYQCDMALTGAVTIRSPKKEGYLYQDGGVLSPDGHCRAFDAKSKGIVGGNGVGVVILKRLEDAMADGDSIHAVIKGSAINNDGSLKVGFTAPSVDGQAEVIAEAQAMAGVDPETITYIETHGTGTALGDPIEIAALTQAFRLSTQKKGFCAIGSVKTNLGHLDTAAGIAGIIKTVQALKHRQIPPSLHFEQPNPAIDFANSPFKVNTKLSQWKTNGPPRRAGISSFGIGGTNAHVILEEAPSMEPSGIFRPWQLLVLSAHTSTALNNATANMAEHLHRYPDLNLADVTYTLQVGRKDFSHRRILVCKSTDEAVTSLNTMDSKKVFTHCQEEGERTVAFLFPGQGAQYVNMGRELYEIESTFREQVDHCSEILKPYLKLDLRELLYPKDKDSVQGRSQEEQLQQTIIAQPALFVVEYALARLWMEWGIQPEAMIGHSLGEYVAACISGVFSLEEALGLVASRGQLIQQLPGGSMLAISLSEEKIQPYLMNGISLAAVNGPSLCVLSGNAESIEIIKKQFKEQDVECRLLHTSHAFHSEMIEPILDSFLERVRETSLNFPQIPYISNVTGSWITQAEAIDPEYWVRHLRQTVRFSEGARLLLEQSERVMLEVGPGRALSTFVKRQSEKPREFVILSSLRQYQESQPDVSFMLSSLGRLWLSGVTVDWSGFSIHERRCRLPLPTYPFERKRYWIDIQRQKQYQTESVLTTKREDIADWFSVPSWKRTAPLPYESIDTASLWLIFMDECEVGAGLAKRLRNECDNSANQRVMDGLWNEVIRQVITVRVGERFVRLNESEYVLNPRKSGDYEALFDELRLKEKLPTRIVYAWTVTENIDSEKSDEHIRCLQDSPFMSSGYYSLLFLTQALVKQDMKEKFHIIVVSNNMQEVTGEETLCPEKATLMGPVKVIPQEYPNILCKSIDILLPLQGSRENDKQIDFLLSEFDGEQEDTVVAYRGNHRWVQTFEPAHLDEVSGIPYRLREGGTYLITGGLGGIGLLLAEYLARTVKGNLVITGRTRLPARQEWDKWLETEDVRSRSASEMSIDLEKDAEYINTQEKKIENELGIRGIEWYAGLKETMEELCACYIFSYLTDDRDIKTGYTCDKVELKKRLNVLPKFDKFFDFFIQVLTVDQIIKIEDDSIIFLKGKEDLKDQNLLKKEAEERYPEFKAMIGVVEYFAHRYRDALSGKIEAISVLFPDGQSGPVEEVVKNTVEHTRHRQYIMLVKDIISKIVAESQGKPLRILELGGGKGVLTKEIIPILKGQNVKYYFTDIGKSFVIEAEKEAEKSGYSFMKFGLLDVSTDPVKQGYKKHSFDVILELDVVHATRSVRKTVGNVKQLLAPNGILLFIETVKLPRWSTMAYGLAEGWWYYDDKDIRKDSPLLNLEMWENVLKSQGLKSVRSYPQVQEKRRVTDCGLIVAQMDDQEVAYDTAYWIAEKSENEEQRLRNKIRKLRELEELGSKILYQTADISDEDQMRSVVARAYEQFGEIHGVIHSAASENRGPIELKSPDSVESEFSAKITGTRILNLLLKDKHLDFMILCSSHSALLPGVGDVEYCSANAFLDAYAIYVASTNGIPIISINWDRWENIGMAVAYEKLYQSRTGETPEGGMTPQEGVNVFHRILSRSTSPQVIVSTRDFNILMKQTNIFQMSGSEDHAQTVPLHSRPALNNAFIPPGNNTEKSLAEIWQEVLGIEHIGINDNFSELGGDSLLAIKILSRMRETFGVDITVQMLFEKPTIAELSERIETIRWAKQGVKADSSYTADDQEEGVL